MLKEIIDHKIREIEALKKLRPLSTMRAYAEQNEKNFDIAYNQGGLYTTFSS